MPSRGFSNKSTEIINACHLNSRYFVIEVDFDISSPYQVPIMLHSKETVLMDQSVLNRIIQSTTFEVTALFNCTEMQQPFCKKTYNPGTVAGTIVHTSKVLPSGYLCQEGTNSTMWSLTERSHSISRLHMVRRSTGSGSNLHNSPNTDAAASMKRNQSNSAVQNHDHFLQGHTVGVKRPKLSILHALSSFTIRSPEACFIPERLVIALEIANAVHTPLPPPDMSSPSSSFANLSFIISTSVGWKTIWRLRYERNDSNKEPSLILYNYTYIIYKITDNPSSSLWEVIWCETSEDNETCHTCKYYCNVDLLSSPKASPEEPTFY